MAETNEYPFTDCCDICGEKWKPGDLENIRNNITRDYVGPVCEEFDYREGKSHTSNVYFQSELVTRHTDIVRCLIGISKQMGLFQTSPIEKGGDDGN